MGNRKEALELQQEFYEKLGDRRWDLIKRNQRWALESKVAFAMFGEPRKVSYNGYTSVQMKEVEKICDLIYKTSRTPDVLVAFLFVIGNSEHGSFIVPILRVQNNCDNNYYFIDNIGRVYKNWKDYKENIKLPPSEVYYPANGIYDSDEYGNVLLEITESPASSDTSKALSVVDKGVGFTSVVLAGVGLVSIFFPPAAAAVGLASAGCGVYGVGRSVRVLSDRRSHAQSISFADSEARNCWLSVLGCSLGVGSVFAMKGMVNAVAQGQVVRTAGRLVDTLNLSSMTVNGIGIANNLANLVEKNKNNELTSLDFLQFTTSLLFFTNAAMNAKTASSVIDQVQKDSLSNSSSDLSKRITEAINKLVRKSGGDGTMEDTARIIKGITNVGNIYEFFRMTIRAQKQSSSTVLNGEGKFVVNGNAYVDTDIKLQTHVKNIPTVTVSSTTPYTQNRLVYDTTVEVSKLIEIICVKHKKEFITLVDGVKIAMKDLYSFFEKFFKKYFSSKEKKCTFPSNEIINFINNSETFAQSKGCKTKEDYIDFVHFLFIYEKSKLKEREKKYQREKDNARKLLGEEFDESVFAQKWGIEDVNNREGSFLKIINDKIKESNKELKEQYEKCEIEIPAINEDGGLKFKSKYHALNVYYHFFVIDGEELTPSRFLSLIRRIVIRNNISKLTHDVHRNSRIITYIDEEGILVNVEECEDGRFFKSVSIFK